MTFPCGVYGGNCFRYRSVSGRTSSAVTVVRVVVQHGHTLRAFWEVGLQGQSGRNLLSCLRSSCGCAQGCVLSWRGCCHWLGVASGAPRGCTFSCSLCLSPGPFFSAGGQPAPPGPSASWTKSQSLDPFADLGDLSSGLQGDVPAPLGVRGLERWRSTSPRRVQAVCPWPCSRCRCL